jgi:putative DNA primase/helicase
MSQAAPWTFRGPEHDLLTQGLHDAGNACRLVSLYGKDLHYCHAMKKWLRWDGRRWKPDSNGEAYRLAKRTIQAFAVAAIESGDKPTIKFATASLDDRRIAHMLSSARCEIYVEPDALDSHPMMLNALNGTIDLETGELRPHRREDFITKLVHVNYNPDAGCPRWLKFLRQILNPNLLDYLQRAIGYSLTAVTVEKAVFALYGVGNNGKTTLLTAIRELIREYSAVIQAETLMARAHDTNNALADLCDLRGARFAHTSECERGQKLSQARLKTITQGMGHIKATRKFENPIIFPETHKLWLDTNVKPEIRDVDDLATINRLHPIPFLVAIPKDEIDPGLQDKLRAEFEGILAWGVEGARRWHSKRLGRPSEVEAAAEAWRAENDTVGRFIDERCVIGSVFTAKGRMIYDDYQVWIKRSGEKTGVSNHEFSARLIAKGFHKKHTERGEVYEGIGLRTESTEGES